MQIAIDPDANGGWAYDAKDVEIGAALGESGIVKHVFAGGLADFDASIIRCGNDTTRYYIAIPWAGLGIQAHSGTRFGFNILANDCDGRERIAWIDLTPGIGEVKAPILYMKLTLVN